jgi:mannose-6-phosphate isomerase-like protein (cupin superfamily)
MTPDAFYSEVVFTRTDTFRVMNTARDKSGEAEIHADWTDNMVVQEGEATFMVGGTVVDARTTAPGEQRGKSITGGTAMPMRPGDYFLIPAGTPHQMIVAPGKKIKFLAFKTKK